MSDALELELMNLLKALVPQTGLKTVQNGVLLRIAQHAPVTIDELGDLQGVGLYL